SRRRGDPATVDRGRFNPANAGQAVTVRADAKRDASRGASDAGRLHSAGAGALRAHASHAACGRASDTGAERNPGAARRTHRRSSGEAPHDVDATARFGWLGPQGRRGCAAYGRGASCASTHAAIRASAAASDGSPAVRPTDGQLNTGDPAFRTTAGSSLNTAFVSQVIETNSISAALFAAAQFHVDSPSVCAYSATSRIVEWLPAGR